MSFWWDDGGGGGSVSGLAPVARLGKAEMGLLRPGLVFVGLLLLAWRSESLTLSTRLIHRFSDEAREIWSARSEEGAVGWLSRGSADYYRALVGRDLWRQKNKLGVRHQVVFPSEGGGAVGLGNDFGW